MPEETEPVVLDRRIGEPFASEPLRSTESGGGFNSPAAVLFCCEISLVEVCDAIFEALGGRERDATSSRAPGSADLISFISLLPATPSAEIIVFSGDCLSGEHSPAIAVFAGIIEVLCVADERKSGWTGMLCVELASRPKGVVELDLCPDNGTVNCDAKPATPTEDREIMCRDLSGCVSGTAVLLCSKAAAFCGAGPCIDESIDLRTMVFVLSFIRLRQGGCGGRLHHMRVPVSPEWGL